MELLLPSTMHHLTKLLLALSLMLSSSPVYGQPPGIFDTSAGYGPVFEEQPVDTIYPEESPEDKIIMSCGAKASPPATYKWRLNNWDIKIQEGSDDHYSLEGGNLLISNPEKSKHAGNYSCLATNDFGTVISREASVQFGYLDMFSTEEREAVYVKEGQGVVLLCAPPPHFPDDLSFRWMLNEFPIFIPLDKRRFISQTTGNLFISRVEGDDSGNYSCFAQSPSIPKSVFSKFIPLVPLTERHIRKYPADIKVKFTDTYALVGQNITLECFALGNPIPQIKWRKVDGTLPVHHEIGLAGGLLHLFNVQYEDEGLYECEALNSKGKDWHKAHLYVEASPEWVEHIHSSERDIGSDYAMSCQASGNPKPRVRFLKNGQMYVENELKFTDLTPDDSGMYQCIAENRHGVIYANAELRVFVGAPSFELNQVKQNLLGAKNGRVVIECKPKAAPKPTVSWSKGTELLSNTSRIFIWEDGSLEIRNVTKSDEGKYTCFAENDRGKANSTGSLSVTDATKITLAPSNADVIVGENAKMQCAASHDSNLDIIFIWSLNGHVINLEKEGEYYQHIMDGQSGSSSCELQIKNIQLKHAGRYTCTAQTTVDNVTASADLVVRGPPGPPGGLRVEDIGPKFVRLVWSQGSDNLSPISKYTIQYRETSTPEEDWKDAATTPPNIEGNTETATVVELNPWTEYEFRVIATNTLGTGEPSSTSSKTRTDDAVPLVAPSDVGGGGGTSKELVITWKPVEPKYYYGSDFGYKIAFKPQSGNEWHKVTIMDPKADRYVHKDPSIPPATEFEVKVKAFNKKGEGPYSLTAVIRSAQDPPSEAPEIEEAKSISATEVNLVWRHVQQPRVEGYLVKYWRKSMENEAMTQRMSKNDNQTRLEKLKPNSHYVIEMRAFNGAGYGPANQLEIYTKKAPPSQPPKIISQKMKSSGTMINVAWERVEPLANESSVQCYKVLYRRENQNSGSLYTTSKQSIDVPVPKDGHYFVEVRAQSEGGDGAVAKVRISGGGIVAAQSLGVCVLLLVAVLSLAL